MKSSLASSKLERKTVERNRRKHMKSLCFKLASLIPNRYSKEALSGQDQLEQAAIYIKNMNKSRTQRINEGINEGINRGMMLGLSLPVIEVRDLGSFLEVVLITGLEKTFLFCKVIAILEEEGADVFNANFCNVGDKVFHIIHSQVTSSRVGFESTRVYERLKELMQ